VGQHFPQTALCRSFEFDELHEICANLMIALIALHVLAALKHHFIDCDVLLWRVT
jgi:cytochrome b561